MPTIGPGPSDVRVTSIQSNKIDIIDCLTIPSFTHDAASSTVNQPGYSAGMFSVSGTPSYADTSSRVRVDPHRRINPYPARRIQRSKIDTNVSTATLKAWAIDVGLELGPLIPTEEDRHKVLCLLYHYRHLNGTDLTNLSCTDLIVHRVRIAPGTKPVNNPTQKRWPAHSEWWLRKIIQEGIEGRVYESTEAANGRLSLWNARAVIVDKVESPTPQDEPRVTFDYSRVTEELPGTYMELSSKVHDNLADPRHRCLFSADLKHAYLGISLHPDDRHYFAFTISGIGQLQPTRMQQGSQSAGFTLNELVYRAFGALPPPHREPSLLHSNSPEELPVTTFYMNDFFDGFRSFEEQYDFLMQHFLPRIEWALLQLSFKKLKLFAKEIKALGVTHRVGGFINVLESRIKKILEWKAPNDQTEVRSFLGVVGITRRWVKNFAEIARPLARLTGKVPWKWGQSEQLSFEILQIKCATRTSMCGINLSLPVHFYTDASNFAAGLAITQFQDPFDADTQGSKLVEVPILYDSFPWTVSQKKYPVYKKELCAIVTFVKKYDYLCKHPYIPAVVHTDHKPLTYFLASDLHEGIYGHWADKLHRLNVSIVYIPGHRNKVADGLSRTLFDSDCSDDIKVQRMATELADHGSHWVWKDGKGGFEEFLTRLNLNERLEVVEHGTISGVSVFGLEFMTTTSSGDISWKQAYKRSIWFGDIYEFLTNSAPVPSTKVMKNAMIYRVVNEVLWIHHRSRYLPCIPEAKIRSVLLEAHDQAGHWAKTGTLARLRGLCYWPNQSEDVEKYIAGCLECARHGPATRSQLLNPVRVSFPFQLLGMDFIGPLAVTKAGNTYIFNVVCYFSKKIVPFATPSANASDVIESLRKVFTWFRRPYAIYCDRGQHFDNPAVRDYLNSEGVSISYSPSGSSKSTGMIEVSNKLLEDVLRKSSGNIDWDQALDQATKSVNSRVISYLGMSSTDIIIGPIQEVTPTTSTLLALPGRDISDWVAELCVPISHIMEVRSYLRFRSDSHDYVRAISQRRQEDMASRYDRGVRPVYHQLQDLVMLHQKISGKLQPRWRGPFRIQDYGGSHGKSFVLRQLNGRKIRGAFHGDDLKAFIPRTGYLDDGLILPTQQTIRKPRIKPTKPGIKMVQESRG
jgi:hypothetical protein